MPDPPRIDGTEAARFLRSDMTPSPLDQSDSVSLGADPHLPDPLPADPFPLFHQWFQDAREGKVQPNPNAFTLATIDPDGRPSARVVLCKGLSLPSGYVVFYTNRLGRKGRALEANPRAAAVFHWDDLDRQARMEGLVTRSPEEESDAYFNSRPWISRLGAWASNQSEPVEGRAALKTQLDEVFRRFGLNPNNPPARDAQITIPRPPHWGGYRLWADRVELWVGGTGRLHDRARWSREVRMVTGPAGSTCEVSPGWVRSRLQP